MTPSRPALARLALPAVVSFATALGLAPAACSTPEPRRSIVLERTIAPVLDTSCARTNTGAGCHVADGRGNALGNLDVTSFENVDRRRDLLADYGPYGQPAFLAKVVEPFQVEVQTWDGRRVTVRTDIRHAGGSVLDPAASGYQTVRRWIQNGASENNTGDRPRRGRAAVFFVPARRPNRRVTGVADLRRLATASRRAQETQELPRHRRQLVSPAATGPRRCAELVRRYRVPRATPELREPARPRCPRAARTTRAASCSTRRTTTATARSWRGPRSTSRKRRRSTPVDFFAHRAAGAREEVPHDAAVPLGLRLPRLPPEGWLGRQLQPGDAAEPSLLLELAPESDDHGEPHGAEELTACAMSGCEGRAARAPRRRALQQFGAAPRRPACEGKGYDHAGDLDAIPAYRTMLSGGRERGVFRTAPPRRRLRRRPLGGVGRVISAPTRRADFRLATLPRRRGPRGVRRSLRARGLRARGGHCRRPPAGRVLGFARAFAARRSAAERLPSRWPRTAPRAPRGPGALASRTACSCTTSRPTRRAARTRPRASSAGIRRATQGLRRAAALAGPTRRPNLGSS